VTLQERFDQKYVVRESGCWEWVAAVRSRYGVIVVGSSRTAKAHRVSWEIHRGPIPAGLKVLHVCDNPPCVNPDHLFLGTQADNLRDMVQKGRARGNPIGPVGRFTDEQVNQIRSEYRRNSRETGTRALAKRYGVSHAMIWKIVNHEAYKSVTKGDANGID
jgi:hypothetical protein